MTSTNFDPRILKAPHPVPGAPDNWKRFFSINTDAKVIGIQYIATSLLFLLVGGLLAMIVRGELITPEADLVDPTVYNGLYTMHGTVMLFLFLFPVLNGLNNLLIPTMIGAPDMAFPKLNAAAFWLVPVFAVLLMASFFVPGGPAQAGWWSYPPVSIQNPLGHFFNGQQLWLLAVALSGISSIFGAINFVTTIIRMRAPGMGFFKMPLYCWTAWGAQTIQLIGLPALTGGAIMLLFDLSFGTSFFKPEGGGDPVLYQHFFWFYSHPAVYVMVLPVFVGFLLGAALLAWILMHVLELHTDAGRALAFSLGTRNSFVVLPFALALPDGWETTVVVIVFQSLVELFGMVFYLWWLPRHLFRSTP